MAEASPTLLIGREIGPFHIVSVIGRGGMGVVYKAERVDSGALVALKTVRGSTSQVLWALRSEIASLRAIRHPGVVQVIDQGIDDGLPWYAMELLEGHTLADFNRSLWPTAAHSSGVPRTTTVSTDDGLDPAMMVTTAETRSEGLNPVPQTLASRALAASGRLRDVLVFYQKLCAPLAHLHSRGLVHRDLKPANIFLRPDGTPVLVDFGLVSYARGTIGRETLPAATPALGTVSYVPPEQILGRFVDARADLYSMGCMLYESVAGRPPFLGHGQDALARHLSEHPIAPSEIVDGVAPELDALILGLLAKSPQERLGYVADVASTLAELSGALNEPVETNYLYRPQIAGRQTLLARLAERLRVWVRDRAGWCSCAARAASERPFWSRSLPRANGGEVTA